MNSLPPEHRGAGSGMNTTFQNSAQVFSIGIFFTLMIVGLTSTLPHSLFHGLVGPRGAGDVANRAAHLPPVSTLFAAFLGYNPVQHLIGAHALGQLPLAQQQVLIGGGFFPGLITAPFQAGLHAALDFAIVASLLAAGASWIRGGRYVYTEPGRRAPGRRRDRRSRRAGLRSPAPVRHRRPDGRCPDRRLSRPVRRDDAGSGGRPDGCRMIDPERRHQPGPTVLRIGEVAKLTGLTTRTLRYWEELGLISPSALPGPGRAALLGRPTWPGSPGSGICRSCWGSRWPRSGWCSTPRTSTSSTGCAPSSGRASRRPERRRNCWTRPSTPTTASGPSRQHPGPHRTLPGRAGGQGGAPQEVRAARRDPEIGRQRHSDRGGRPIGPDGGHHRVGVPRDRVGRRGHQPGEAA